jgi:hypothetical protein
MSEKKHQSLPWRRVDYRQELDDCRAFTVIGFNKIFNNTLLSFQVRRTVYSKISVLLF